MSPYCKRLLLPIVCLALTSQSTAGVKRGLVGEISAGLAPVSRFEVDSLSESATAFTAAVSNGYCFDSLNVICLNWVFSWRKSEYYTEEGRQSAHLDGSPLGDQWIRLEFLGVSWLHYFRPGSRSLFYKGGVGFCAFDKSDFGKHNRGLGWMGVVGYQLSRRVEIGVWLIGGRTKYYDGNYTHRQVGIMLSGLVY